MLSANQTFSIDFQTKVNQLVALLDSSKAICKQLKLYCDDACLENCFKNICTRRRSLSEKLKESMGKSDLKIDDRMNVPTKYAFPDSMDEVDLIYHFTNMDSLLQKKYRDLLVSPECPPQLKDTLMDHNTIIDADNRELSFYIPSGN